MRMLCLTSLLCAATLVVAADLPEEATIVRPDNSTIQGRVISETLDNVVFLLGEGAGAETTLPRAKVKRVDYGTIADADYSRALGTRGKGEFEKAGEAFLKAMGTSSYARVRELSAVEAARSFFSAKKYDLALKALADLEAAAPRSIHLPAAYQLRADILLAKGDAAGAEAAAKALDKFDPIRAAVVRAGLRRVAGKPAEAAAELKGIWGSKLTEASEGLPEDLTYAAIGFQMADDFIKAGDTAAAQGVYEMLCYASIGKEAQGKAHLALAERLIGGKDKAALIAAFDHALIAAALSRTQKNAAVKLARGILETFDKDASMKDEVAEYRGYLNNL